jgi:AraC family transcriptional regulator
MENSLAPNGADGNRIVALRDSEVQPLIDEAPSGPLSPSRSLLVERFDLEPTEWQTHVHMDQVLVLYLKSARVQYEAGDRQVSQIQLNRGQFVICKRNHPETLRWQDPASLLCVRIGDAALNEASRSLLALDHVELRPELRVTDARVTNLLYALEAERGGGYQAGDLFTDSIEAALAGLLVTACNRVRDKSVVSQNGLPPRRLRRVLEFIHANIDKQLRLEDIASVAELRASHFVQQFRRSMNTSPYKYVLTLRIEQGKRMLENRHLSVLEVAQAVGFDNPQHFATVFRRIAGVSPSTYRRHL